MAIAAAAIGGNSLAGGRGGLLGALLGAAVIFLIENLLGALGLSSFWSQAVYGATLIIAVVFAALSAAASRRATPRRSTPTNRRIHGPGTPRTIPPHPRNGGRTHDQSALPRGPAGPAPGRQPSSGSSRCCSSWC